MTRPVLFFYKNTGLRPVLTLPKYDTLNYTTPLKRLVEGFIFRYNVRTGLTKISIGTKIIMCASKNHHCFHVIHASQTTSSAVLRRYQPSSSSAVFSLQREQRTKPEARFFDAEYIYLLRTFSGTKQQTTGRSKISSTRSPSRTFSGILLLLPPLPPLRRRRRNQRRSTKGRMRFPLADKSGRRRRRR